MTPERRIEDLEQLIYNIDVACRICVNPSDAIPTIRELCQLAHIAYIPKMEPTELAHKT